MTWGDNKGAPGPAAMRRVTHACSAATRHKRVCKHTRPVPRHTRVRTRMPVPTSGTQGSVTCTGTTSPCRAGTAACASRRGGRGTAPAPAPAPAARSAAGRWAGRSPLRTAARQPPRRAALAPPQPPPRPTPAPEHKAPFCTRQRRRHRRGSRLPPASPRCGVGGPLSSLPPVPGLSQVGGAQPRSQWQCPWLLHTLGGTHQISAPAWVPRPAPPHKAPRCSPRARGTCSGTAGRPALRHPGTGAGDTPGRGGGVRTTRAPPSPSPPRRRSPCRARRLCRAAPWPRRSRPRPWAGGSPGRTRPPWCRHAGTAASRSRHRCGDTAW